MKLISFFILLACFSASATADAQNISLKEHNAPIAKVFKAIEKQSGYSFFYKNDLLKNAKPVTIDLKAVSLSEALEQCFRGQPLIYEVVDKTVIVKTKPQGSIRPKINQLPVRLSGKVTDSTGMPLPGAGIRITGNEVTYITKADGSFLIEANQGDEITVSYIGYRPYVFVFDGQAAYLTVTLHQASSRLNEVAVVSTGYQTLPKERLTGSFAQPNKVMYDSRVSTDVISKLDGITSGVVFNPPTVVGGSSSKISIRGRSTIYANDDPLIVIDNFPYDGDISNINPNDVESVTILKDAAAASIWGVRAGNGVIVITTKKGHRGQPLKINFNANVSVAEKTDLKKDPRFLNSSDFIDVEKFLFDKGFYNRQLTNSGKLPFSPVVDLLSQVRSGTLSATDANKSIDSFRSLDVRDDLERYFYRKPINQQYNININGGTEKATYYVSSGYDKNLLNKVGNDFGRYTFNSSSTFQPLKNLEVTAGINYVQTNSNQDNTLTQLTTGGNYSSIYPYAQLANMDGGPLAVNKGYTTSFVNAAPAKGFLNWKFVPLEELRSQWNTTKVTNDDIRLNASAKYKIIKGLDISVLYQYEKAINNSKTLATQESYQARNLINRYSILTNGVVTGYNIPLGSILNYANSNLYSNSLRGQLTYGTAWGKHRINAIAGAEARQTKVDGSSGALFGYDDDLATSQAVDYVNGFSLNPTGYGTVPNSFGTSGTLDRFLSYFANAAYTYNDRYTISGSARIDGSNYFAVETNQKKVPLWSAGGKWDISKEPFYNVVWLPNLSLRGTYGFNGNLDKSLAAVNTLIYIQNSDLTNITYAMIQNIGNSTLRWEKTGMLNLGIDFATVSNRISGSLEYFSKKGTDLIADATLAPSTGTLNMRGNYANMQGSGLDVQVTARILDGSAFKWTTSFLLSRATSTLTKYTGTPITPGSLPGNGQTIQPVVGKPVSAIYAFKWAGLDPTTGDPQGFDSKGQISKDYTALTQPSSVDQLAYIGSARPQTFGGWNNRFAYKGFSLSFNISYKLDYYFQRSSINYYSLFNYWTGHMD